MKCKIDIFISYLRNGGLQTAGRIKDRLESLGYSVFMDLDSMEYGKEFPKQIQDAIKCCKVFLIVLPYNTGGNAIKKKWIVYEICYAIKFRKRIIPIFLEGYHFPTKEEYPKLPEEFKGDMYVKNKFEYLSNLNGIPFKEDLFNECFDKLLKNLKLRRKLNNKMKFKVILFIVLMLLAVIIYVLYRYNLNPPQFWISLIDGDYFDSVEEGDSWNLNYIISNNGEQLYEGTVVPTLRLKINIISTFKDVHDKSGFLEIEFSDFYKNCYYFDDKNNSVTFFETKGNSLLQFIIMLEKQLEKYDMYIYEYVFETFFEIKYTDRFNVKHCEIFESENNYNFLLTGWNEKQKLTDEYSLIRYFSDERLIKIREIEDPLLSYPLLDCSDSHISWLAESSADYINEFKNDILKTNVYAITTAEDIYGEEERLAAMYGYHVVEILGEDDGYILGFHVWHENCNFELE